MTRRTDPLPDGYAQARRALGIGWSEDLGVVRRIGHRVQAIGPWVADDLIRDHLEDWEYDAPDDGGGDDAA